jgi:spoIIIJ-associated protein
MMWDQGVDSSQSAEIIEEAKTVDGAIEKGLARLGVTADAVEITVLEEGSRGVLGLIGGSQAKVQIKLKDDAGATIKKIEDMSRNLLTLMDVDCQVSVGSEDDTFLVDIETTGADGLLIGKKGQNLEALTYLLKRMVGKQLKRNVRMEVDVGGYRQRRVESLRSKAILMAGRVKSTGKEVQMEPLPAAERRIVHLALQSDPSVKTYTVGDGELRNVVVSLSTGQATDRAEGDGLAR